MKIKAGDDEWEVDFILHSARKLPNAFQLYESISIPTVGDRIVIVWDELGRMTLTEAVVEISDETESDRAFFKNVILSIGLGGMGC